MKQALILLLLVGCLFSCKHSKYNIEAIKLNDSAVAIQMHLGQPGYTKSLNDAIVLLDNAIEIDSNYFTAYLNKWNFQTQLKQYNSAITTGNKMIKLIPNDNVLKLLLGKSYERAGDTVTAKRYYGENLLSINKVLDTMNVNSKSYDNLTSDKIDVLILLRQFQNARDLSDKLYKKGTDPIFIYRYKELSNLTQARVKLLYGDTTNVVASVSTGKTDAELDKIIEIASKPSNAKNN